MKRTYAAAVDADFIFHVAEIKRPPEQAAEILDQILASLDLYAASIPWYTIRSLTSETRPFPGCFRKMRFKSYLLTGIFFNPIPPGRHTTVSWFLSCTGVLQVRPC